MSRQAQNRLWLVAITALLLSSCKKEGVDAEKQDTVKEAVKQEVKAETQASVQVEDFTKEKAPAEAVAPTQVEEEKSVDVPLSKEAQDEQIINDIAMPFELFPNQYKLFAQN